MPEAWSPSLLPPWTDLCKGLPFSWRRSWGRELPLGSWSTEGSSLVRMIFACCLPPPTPLEVNDGVNYFAFPLLLRVPLLIVLGHVCCDENLGECLPEGEFEKDQETLSAEAEERRQQQARDLESKLLNRVDREELQRRGIAKGLLVLDCLPNIVPSVHHFLL